MYKLVPGCDTKKTQKQSTLERHPINQGLQQVKAPLKMNTQSQTTNYRREQTIRSKSHPTAQKKPTDNSITEQGS